MKKLLAILLMYLLPVVPVKLAAQALQSIINDVHPAAGGLTFTLIQHPLKATCTGAGACSLTVTNTTAGNLGIGCATMTSNSGADALSSVTGDGTFSQVPSLNHTIINAASSNFYSVDCFDNLSLTGGNTTLSYTPNKSQVFFAISFLEYHRSSGTWTRATSSGSTNTTCTSCTGVTLPALGAGPNVIVQVAAGSGEGTGAGVISAISGSYTTPFDAAGGVQFVSAGYMFAGWVGATSNAVPTIVQSSDTMALGAGAWK